MAMIEEIRQELNKAEVRLDEMTKKLKKWEEEKYKGEKLNKLEEKLIRKMSKAKRGRMTGWKNRLLKEKEKLKD